MSEGKSGTHTAPGEGESVWVVGDLITLKLTSEDTGGAFSLFEGTISPGGGPPPHVQHREDESFYVMEGQFEFLVGEDTIPGGAGSCVHVSSGTLHTFKNVGTSPGRLLGVLAPGGFEKFFLEAGEPPTEGSSAPEGEPDVGRIVEIGQKYGLEIPPPPGQ
jgi:mannose-6-phosphate isomerase-like protein (cupin superfamily)